MKQRSTTVDGVRLDPHWWSGYQGEIAGRPIIARQYGRNWLVRAVKFGLLGTVLGGGKTLREAVRAAKESV